MSAAVAALASLVPAPGAAGGAAASTQPWVPVASAPAALPFELPAGEPAHTIFHEGWYATRERAERLLAGERELFLTLLDCVESAWSHVRVLKHLYDRLRPTATGSFACVLEFIDTDVCELFRDIAVNVAVFVPEPGGGIQGDPDFNNTCADVGNFGVRVAVLRSTTFDPEFPPAAAAVVRRSAEALLTWHEQLEPTLSLAANAVQGP